MSPMNSTTWRHGNNYNAASSCKYCEGVIRHESWCIAVNEAIAYAYAIASDIHELTLEDGLILHALGVTWTSKQG